MYSYHQNSGKMPTSNHIEIYVENRHFHFCMKYSKELRNKIEIKLH